MSAYKDGYMVPSGHHPTMFDRWDYYELYDAAQVFGREQAQSGALHGGALGAAYWTAWYAARATAAALILAAREAGAGELLIQKLEETARRVASD